MKAIIISIPAKPITKQKNHLIIDNGIGIDNATIVIKKTDLAFKIGIDYLLKTDSFDYIIRADKGAKESDINKILDFYKKGCKSRIVGIGRNDNFICEVIENGYNIQYVRQIKSDVIVYPLEAVKLILKNDLRGYDFIQIL